MNNDVFKYNPKLTDADLKSIDNLYNYQSPIEMIANEMQTKIVYRYAKATALMSIRKN